MDVNEYMKQSLENQARHTKLLEAILDGINSINEQGVAVVNQVSIALPEGTDLKAVGNIIHATPVERTPIDASRKKPEPVVTQVETVAETAKDEGKPAADAPKDEKSAGKKVSIDDARAALKAYASKEGNDAAMELLSSLGASSISSLAEQGPDALQKLIDKAAGKDTD